MQNIQYLISQNLRNINDEIEFCSIKIDELAILPRIRWFPEANEIIYTCWNHKDHIISYIVKILCFLICLH